MQVENTINKTRNRADLCWPTPDSVLDIITRAGLPPLERLRPLSFKVGRLLQGNDNWEPLLQKVYAVRQKKQRWLSMVKGAGLKIRSAKRFEGSNPFLCTKDSLFFRRGFSHTHISESLTE